MFIASGVLGIPALALLGQATALWQVVALTSIVWFTGGLNLALISIFTGLYADGKNRGKSFSLMALSAPLGALTGGAAIGQLVEWQGYGWMFAVLSVIWAALPLVGLLKLQAEPVSQPRSAQARSTGTAHSFGQTFYLLLFLTLLSGTALNISRLGTSLSMQSLNFSPGAVASSATVSGLVTIPVTLLIGALSDRLGRRRFLLLGYLLASTGALILVTATQLWHFWLVATLLMVAFSAIAAMGPAFATDILEPKALNRGLSRMSATASIAGILSFAGTGYMLDTLGPKTFYLIAVVLPVIAGALLELQAINWQAVFKAISGWTRVRSLPVMKRVSASSSPASPAPRRYLEQNPVRRFRHTRLWQVIAKKIPDIPQRAARNLSGNLGRPPECFSDC